MALILLLRFLAKKIRKKFQTGIGIPLQFRVGDQRWVREGWRAGPGYNGAKPSDMARFSRLDYLATPTEGDWGVGRPARHMMRWMSRTTLLVKQVRVERVRDISREDAIAEGFKCLSKDGGKLYKWGLPDRDGEPGADDLGWHWQEWCVDPRDAYAKLWEHINGRESWEADPWVEVATFEVELENVDAWKKAA